MIFSTGMIWLFCLPLILVCAISMWAHGRPMRRREARRKMIARYIRMEWSND